MSGPVKVGRTSSAEVRFSAELCPLVEGARAVSAATKDSVVRKIGIPPILMSWLGLCFLLG
jgi:hypothetical protein